MVVPTFPRSFTGGFSSRRMESPCHNPIRDERGIYTFSLSKSFGWMVIACSLMVRRVVSFSYLAGSKLSTVSLSCCEQSILARTNASSLLNGRAALNSAGVKRERNAFWRVLFGSLTFISETKR